MIISKILRGSSEVLDLVLRCSTAEEELMDSSELVQAALDMYFATDTEEHDIYLSAVYDVKVAHIEQARGKNTGVLYSRVTMFLG